MIIEAKIISRPISGEYDEVIFDASGGWCSSGWSWIKFTRDDYTEWVGQFRGEPFGVATASAIALVCVLTSDKLYFVDVHSGQLVGTIDSGINRNITVTPDEAWFLLSDYYSISRVGGDLNLIPVFGDYSMDSIRFVSWEGSLLKIECEESFEGGPLNLVLDSNDWSIRKSNY